MGKDERFLAEGDGGQEGALDGHFEALRAAVQELRDEPASPAARARLQRRLHALGAEARTGGLFVMAVRICDAQSVLEAADELTVADLETLDELLGELPRLTQKDRLPPAGMPRIDAAEPVTAIVLGGPDVEDLLRPDRVATTSFATARFDEPSHVWAALHPVIPDLFLVDADAPGAHAFVASLVEDARTELAPILVVGRFQTRAEVSMYLALGVTRTFTKPAAGTAVRAAAQDAVEQRRGHTLPTELRIGTLPPPPVRRASPKAEPAVVRAAPASTGPIPLPMLFIARRLVAGDDDPVVAWFVADHFRKMGAHVDEALSGLATHDRALDVSRSVPDLVIAELGMRDLDGHALVRALRADPAGRDVPVLLQSWKDERLEEAREGGLDAGFIEKSASPEALAAKAAELLTPHARLRARLRAGGTLKGSLEGVTVLRLLGLAMETSRAARLVVEDGAFVHELVVTAGALRSVTRTAPDGRVEHGARAMATALGVSRGTFSIEDARAVVMSPLGVAFVTDALSATRALSAAARGAHLPNLAEVRFDPDVAHAVAGLEGHARDIAQRLTGGSSPRAMLSRADCQPAALEEVLVDLCRRGFVTAVREESPSIGERRPVMLLGEPAAAPPSPAPTPAPPAASMETTIPLLLRRQRALLSAPPPVVVEKAAGVARAPSPGVLLFTPLAPATAPVRTAATTAAMTATAAMNATAPDAPDALPEPSLSVPIVFEDPQPSQPLVVTAPSPSPSAPRVVPVPVPMPMPMLSAPPVPIARAFSPPPPPAPAAAFAPAHAPIASPLPSLPPPPATPFTLSPPPGPSLPGALSMPQAPLSAFDVPMPGTHSRDGAASPPPTSVTNRPPPLLPTGLVRRHAKRAAFAVAVASIAILAGAGVRWSVSGPAPRAAAARPATTLSQASVPPQGLLEVAAADGVQIQVDGAERGRGPKLSVTLPEGTHEVKTDGPNAKTRLVEIARGKVTHVDLAWRPAPIPPTR